MSSLRGALVLECRLCRWAARDGEAERGKTSRQSDPVWQTAAVAAAAAAAMRGKDVNCLVGLFSGEGERRAIYFATGLYHC